MPAEHAYKRPLFPALTAYLAKAAGEFRDAPRAAIATPRTVTKIVLPLGHGELVVALAGERRRARWARLQAERMHEIRAFVGQRDYVLPGGVPLDVRQGKHARWLERRAEERRQDAREVVERRVGGLEAGSEELRRVCGRGIRADRRGYVQFLARAREGFDCGMPGLLSMGGKGVAVGDTFEEVRKRYAGRPDELYRRKTARRFARWRRQKLEREAELSRTASRAESEMKRRRGYDHLLTDRRAGDSSFAPFLYELEGNAYAFSSKITEAPKLRKVMIDKYSARDGATVTDGWERAQQVAEQNPLFHTRVMNRFT
ncbi:unnamed protein product [Chondrus crispus]|uniref:Uncharacterized protein n=1 Tax=Chondrus crispus TaxID=2769 RepID=S0F3U5_CHOCR|nr:unnamed protein product [Chondrus crispus]CDF77443.1 unnamed protein product [Chondrus crispus]|eukprot:XP_005712317.1 unnamed protein product [Chondrus crispus]